MERYYLRWSIARKKSNKTIGVIFKESKGRFQGKRHNTKKISHESNILEIDDLKEVEINVILQDFFAFTNQEAEWMKENSSHHLYQKVWKQWYYSSDIKLLFHIICA
jgi:hypothetical protein